MKRLNRKLTFWIKDYAHLISLGVIMYMKRNPPIHYLKHIVKNKVPIIILPGIFMRWASLKRIADHISLLGHPIYIVPKIGNNSEDIPTSAKKVREVIEENNLKNIIIVAHSKGGLISKYLLLHEDPDKRIKGVIAIASPWHGSSITKFVQYTAVQELSPESKIICDLEKETAVNKKIVSIIPSFDNHIWHPEGSFLKGAMENINVAVNGHHKILNNKIVLDKVVEFIEKITKLN